VSEDEHVTPPDPAGTQPKVDRDRLLPARIEPAPRAEEERDEPRAGPLPQPVEGHAVGEPGVVHEAPHAARFQFILGALLAIGAIAIFGLIWAVGQTGEPDGPQWSPWKPEGRGLAAAQQIAAHVGPQYKTTDGKQLVYVEASEMEVGGLELELVKRQTAEDGGEVSRLDGDAMLFRMCGLGEKCAIEGKSSAARGVLLRREAVEIAGYAFRYLPDLEYTVFFLPPSPQELEATATRPARKVMLDNRTLVFGRDDLDPILDVPLRATLKAPPPTPGRVLKAPEAPLVAALSQRADFWFSLSQGSSDDSAYLVLDRAPQPAQIEKAAQEAALEEAMEKASKNALRSAGERR
jgi:hypothetical protein